ncbi:MAG TPA: hypothetical protein QF802_05295 [Candidatus Thalassarchaeaceae archaeon]|jgi:hypothetical protein|nr:hypothetical protein [Candidatus Thalassarchaeaceae archaeon]HJM19852.1 hypothetical protein [Candidatus Thalassarchaeaceae archaeon]
MKLPIVESDNNDAEFENDGWRRQFVASEPRLSEMCELFKSLGKEVMLVPTIQEINELDEACKACFESTKGSTFTIWTRTISD